MLCVYVCVYLCAVCIVNHGGDCNYYSQLHHLCPFLVLACVLLVAMVNDVSSIMDCVVCVCVRGEGGGGSPCRQLQLVNVQVAACYLTSIGCGTLNSWCDFLYNH